VAQFNARHYDGRKKQEWRVEGKRTLLLQDVDLRRAWYLRANPGADPNKGIRWFYEHKKNFDVQVLRTYTNYVISEAKRFQFSVIGTSAEPYDLHCWYVDEQGVNREIPGLSFVEHADRRHTYRAVIPFDALNEGERLPKLITKYFWKGGARTTTSRILGMREQDRDYFHRRQMDCVYSLISMPIAWAEISLLIPLEWAPDRGLDGVKAYIKREEDDEPVESPQLTRQILPSGDGHYSLRIPYPDLKTRYYLAWKVFDDSAIT